MVMRMLDEVDKDIVRDFYKGEVPSKLDKKYKVPKEHSHDVIVRFWRMSQKAQKDILEPKRIR